MKKHIISILCWTALFIPAIATQSCSGEKVSEEALSAARENGRKRALEFSPTCNLDTFKMEGMLIDVRERENRLRDMGHKKLADEYIGTFLATLDSVNPSLASQLRD